MDNLIHLSLDELDNLHPGSKFTIKNCDKIYVLLGYTSNRNIVYFEESDKTWINNLQVNSNSVIDNIVYYNKLEEYKKLKIN